MEPTRNLLAWTGTILGMPLVVLAAVCFAVLMAFLFYLLTAFTLVRTLLETLLGCFFAAPATRDADPPAPAPITGPTRALADG